MPTVTEQLRKYIAQSGQSQAEIARGAGVAESVLSRFSSGRSTLGGENLDRVCAYLGVALTKPAASKGGKGAKP